ncbi:MAG: protein translocase subunit SecD [Propionibacteriales bacterium]|nr:protein translocase subunit SecD [Propionibacteriales bacterium]
MAKKTYRPGRNLVIFFLGVGVLYGLVALGGNWKPELGLDLQGGTRITLIAKDNPSKGNLNEARKIIDKRVNASGVAESEVVVQGSKFIVVEIPGKTKRDLVDVVKRQAQLRFRLVSKGPQDLIAAQQPTVEPSTSPTAKPTKKPSSGATATNRPRPVPLADPTPGTPTTTPTTAPSSTPSSAPTAAAPVAPCPTDNPGISQTTGLTSTRCQTLDQVMEWAASPPADWTAKFNAFTCPAPGAAPVNDDPNEPLLTCDANGLPYLLTKSIIEGTGLQDAGAVVPDKQVQWVVTLDLKGDDKFTKTYPTSEFSHPTDVFGKISTEYAGTGKQFAMVLDGVILSAPTLNVPITDGNSQIEGNFTESSARSLANALKFGALPVAFEDDPSTENIGPSLAGDQLSTGLLAGALGLFAVMLYCLFYYRGLGLVVLASLAIAAGVTYGSVLLLSKTAGFTLTLPGIAGLIIGVGVTADSFVIFFERIRDEMREGRSMRVAVETGWKRARQTRMAANVVSLLSAAVLYTFATGVVKGFGFALGLSTAIDLAVLFWFTKPAVSWLARFKFFNGGGRMSGLSAETLGMDAVGAPAGAGITAGGRA